MALHETLLEMMVIVTDTTMKNVSQTLLFFFFSPIRPNCISTPHNIIWETHENELAVNIYRTTEGMANPLHFTLDALHLKLNFPKYRLWRDKYGLAVLLVDTRKIQGQSFFVTLQKYTSVQ